MEKLAFIGGGNMARAIIGGLLKSGRPGSSIVVIEPDQAQRAHLIAEFGVHAMDSADASLADVSLVVWAVKPQAFRDAVAPCAPHVSRALHLSVMAGIRSDALAKALNTDNIVRAMPNTPALIGMGVAGLYARGSVSLAGRAFVETVLASTGSLIWVDAENDLDAVTALSGSGPAYVFYFVEAMIAAAVDMGLSADQGRTLALATFAGASELARRSEEPVSTLRERVTSKGGTTFAALSSMNADDVQSLFIKAMQAARARATELGDEFGN